MFKSGLGSEMKNVFNTLQEKKKLKSSGNGSANGPINEEQAKREKKAALAKLTEDRVQLGTWSPKDNTFAVGKGTSLFIFTEKRSGGFGKSEGSSLRS